MFKAIGLMSGTSMDGIDAALIETDGKTRVKRGPSFFLPYSDAFRQRLATCMRDLEDLEAVERALTAAHADAVTRFAGINAIDLETVDVIGFHGQTILHEPEKGRCLQIGDGKQLAKLLGRPVVNSFRAADVAAGGEGAPLAPLYHRALTSGQKRPIAVLNIGGVANITYIGKYGRLIAFDTGPGNAAIDDLVLERTGKAYDESGQMAARGQINQELIATWLADPYFDRAAPKSLDRNDFDLSAARALPTEEATATLTAFTVASILRAIPLLPAPPRAWFITGGGRHNASIMDRLAALLDVPVKPIETIGADGDSLEAEAFAYLAVRHLKNLPLSLPGTTGVPRPQRGGSLHKA